ncbi:Putative ribonuclease H protein At1g65750 [Linum perenne]
MIRSAVEFGYWKTVSLVKNGIPLSHCFFADDLVLFGEASVEQARVISDILDRFCGASGQSVSKNKSRIYFSKNTPRSVKLEVVNLLGIAATPDLGRYLGVPILHGRVTKHTYDYLLDRLDSRLAGWKADNLSLAGRVSLASSVLNSLPCYVMQTASLPLSLCDKIDRKIRNFIWGSSNGVRKIHNVNWDSVCKPKKMGGLGLRSARELNKAFLMKVAWNIITRPEELWVKALVSKYLIRNSVGFTLRSNSGFSSLWRGVMKVWNHTLNGIQWSIKNGKKTNFWKDRWLDSGDILFEHAKDIQGVDLSLAVSDFVLDNGMWDLNKLSDCLTNDAVLQVFGMSPPNNQLGDDTAAWGLDPSGRFTVNSAYLAIKDCNVDGEEKLWRKVWQWKGPEKIKHFLWLVSQGKLMTNEERRRRHIAADAICPECQDPREDLDHVLRRCRVAHEVWREAYPAMVTGDAADLNFNEWWYKGLDSSDAHLKFGVINWLLWHRRNRLVFQAENSSAREVCSQVKFWVHFYSSCWKALQVSREAPGLARQAHLIGWRPAEEGCFTLNSDGSLYTNPNRAAAGGVIRDDNGRFVSAFSMNLGSCSVMRTELRGIVEGMKRAWNIGIRNLRIQSDSEAAVKMLTTPGYSSNQHESLIQQFAELSSRNWRLSIHHIYREANFAADYMANLGHSLDLGIHFFDSPDVALQYWLRFDTIGVCTPRFINNNIL